jgi:hypothetical protein
MDVINLNMCTHGEIITSHILSGITTDSHVANITPVGKTPDIGVSG